MAKLVKRQVCYYILVKGFSSGSHTSCILQLKYSHLNSHSSCDF